MKSKSLFLDPAQSEASLVDHDVLFNEKDVLVKWQVSCVCASERRRFKYSPEKISGSYENPILMSGDLVLVRDNIISATSTVVGEVVAPFMGFNSIYNFFKGVF